MEDELAEMVSAPIVEVTLLASDISLHDLPIVIGDETVVFPGDDFRAGQGKILQRPTSGSGSPRGGCWATTTPTSGCGARRRTSCNSLRVHRGRPGSPLTDSTWRFCGA